MKAIVFAAGIGKRLRPFTDEHPKALAPICGRPAIGIVIDKLIDAGADAIVINVHHFASQVVDYVMSQHYPVEIEVSDESSQLLETGGAIANIVRESRMMSSLRDDEAVIVHNADIITDFPIESFLTSLKAADASILVDPLRPSSRKFLFDSNYILKGWIDKSKGIVRPASLDVSGLSEAAFGGVHALRRHTMEDISDYCGELHPFSITDYYIDRAGEMKIKGYTPEKEYQWFDIGTPERLEAAQSFLS